MHDKEPAPTSAARATCPMKSRGGLARVWRAASYSRDGLRSALRHEHAFRQEATLCLPLLIAAAVLPVGWLHTALLAASLVFVLLIELLNSAIEACVDHISLEYHPLAKRAKDMGSAAVTLSITIAALIWAGILLENFL
jgi:diacylglycerol kinase (ATP)